jgi:hypothetical protein
LALVILKSKPKGMQVFKVNFGFQNTKKSFQVNKIQAKKMRKMMPLMMVMVKTTRLKNERVF